MNMVSLVMMSLLRYLVNDFGKDVKCWEKVSTSKSGGIATVDMAYNLLNPADYGIASR